MWYSSSGCRMRCGDEYLYHSVLVFTVPRGEGGRGGKGKHWLKKAAAKMLKQHSLITMSVSYTRIASCVAAHNRVVNIK